MTLLHFTTKSLLPKSSKIIPILVEKEMKKKNYPKRDISEILKLLNNIDNIRPVGAIFPWLRSLAAQVAERFRHPLMNILDEVIEMIFDDFGNNDFVVKWSKVIDQDFIPQNSPWIKRIGAFLIDLDFHEYVRRIDSIDEAEDILFKGVGTSSTGLDRYEQIRDHKFYSNDLQPAFKNIKTNGDLYIVYGHTHIPEIIPIENRRNREVVLFNTGTFRPRIFACRGEPKHGFITHKTLSYAIFYRRDEEKRAVKQNYEFWEGRLSEG